MEICRNCGYYGHSKSACRGEFSTEVMLWLMLLVPGIVYSIWRLTTRSWVCPCCDAPYMVPEDSPVGQEITKRFYGDDPQVKPYAGMGTGEVNVMRVIFGVVMVVAILALLFSFFGHRS